MKLNYILDKTYFMLIYNYNECLSELVTNLEIKALYLLVFCLFEFYNDVYLCITIRINIKLYMIMIKIHTNRLVVRLILLYTKHI